MKMKELLAKRQNLVNQAKAILDNADKEKRDLTADEDAQFAKLHADADGVKAEMDALAKQEKTAQARKELQDKADQELADARRHGIDRDRHPASAAGHDGDDRPQNRGHGLFAAEASRNLAINGWARHQNGMPCNDAQRQAARECQMNIRNSGFNIPLNRAYGNIRREFRNLSTTTGATGGFATMPEGFIAALEMAMLLYGPMLQVSEVMRTGSGEPMSWPTANDTGNSGRQIGESAAVTPLDPSFAKVNWTAYKFTSDEVKVPFELLQDSAFDIASMLGMMLGERLGRILNTKFTTGTGAGTAKGIVTAATLGKTTASSTVIAADEILDLVHSVSRAYRVGAGFMFSDAVCLAIRKLKDAENRYLWSAGLGGGMPDTLCTYPVHINDDMATSIATTNKTMLFGQLSKYKVRMVDRIRLYRLVERHRENDEDAFLAFVRADGNLLDAGVAPVKYMVQV